MHISSHAGHPLAKATCAIRRQTGHMQPSETVLSALSRLPVEQFQDSIRWQAINDLAVLVCTQTGSPSHIKHTSQVRLQHVLLITTSSKACVTPVMSRGASMTRPAISSSLFSVMCEVQCENLCAPDLARPCELAPCSAHIKATQFIHNYHLLLCHPLECVSVPRTSSYRPWVTCP